VSDRRSFSEIPADLLRDHGVDARVERVWERLEADLAAPRPRRHGAAPAWALVSVATFVLGVGVGGRWSSKEPVQPAAVGAEPSRIAPAAAAPLTSAPSTDVSHDLPRARPTRHATGVRHVESDTVAQETPVDEVVAKTTNVAEWQHLADEGEYARALAALEASGGFDVALSSATADQLMSLVDVARATGQRDRAVLALRRIVSDHGSDPNAPVAAWMLGNELAKAHDPAGAEQAFATYRALSPGGDFAEDALARQIDMASEQGNSDRAHKLAEQYLKEFPDGPRTADIQAELEQWTRNQKPPPAESPVHASDDVGVSDAGAAAH
jgi:hypothetical protein